MSNNRIRVNEFFYLDELVCPEIYHKFGARSIQFIPQRSIKFLTALRILIDKPFTVNNWLVGGPYKYSGLRPLDCPIGAKNSLHKYGMAWDLKVKGMTPKHVEAFILRNWPILRDYGLTTLENTDHTKTWTHIDGRNTGLDELLIVNP